MKPAVGTIAAVLAIAIVVPIGAAARPPTNVATGPGTGPACAPTATSPKAAAMPLLGGRLRPMGARLPGCAAAR